MATSVKGNKGAFFSGEKTVTTAGTAEALGSGIYRSVTIIAKSANTNQVYVGGDDVASTTNDGLDALDVLEIESERLGVDLAQIYIDVDTNGEGVDIYATR